MRYHRLEAYFSILIIRAGFRRKMELDVAVTRTPYGLGFQKPTQKLAHWVTQWANFQ